MKKPDRKRPKWAPQYVWDYYSEMESNNPEKPFLEKLLTNPKMIGAWTPLTRHIEKNFPREPERFAHFCGIVYQCTLGPPAKEKLPKAEADEQRTDAAKQAKELATKLEFLGYWTWGPKEIAPDVFDWLTDAEKKSWNSILGVDNSFNIVRLLKRLSDKLLAENEMRRYVLQPGGENAGIHYLGRYLAEYLKNNLGMKRGYRGIIAATVSTCFGCNYSEKNVKKLLEK